MGTINKGVGIIGAIAIIAIIAAKPAFIAPTFTGVSNVIHSANTPFAGK